MSVYICSNSDCDKPKEPSQRFCNGNFCETLTKLGPLNSKSLQKQGFDREIIFKLDGNMWFAHGTDFINLQESRAGFGETLDEALEDLFKNELK